MRGCKLGPSALNSRNKTLVLLGLDGKRLSGRSGGYDGEDLILLCVTGLARLPS